MPPKPVTPICPKCGYDQSGDIASWKNQCPTAGTCSECGLEFQWANIFDPTRTHLTWYTEHTRSLFKLITKTPATLLNLILPHRFWRAVDITKATHPWRLSLWVIFIMVMTHLLISIPNGVLVWNKHNWNQRTLTQHYQTYGGYGIAEIIFDAIAFPYYNALPEPYTHKWTLYFERGWPEAWYETFFKVINFQLGFLLIWLLVLVVIPTTKRHAKIRTAHVVRAAALSTLIIFMSVEFFRLFRVLHENSGLYFDVFTPIQNLVVPTAILWQIIFWSCAIKIGWKVQRWKSLVILGTTAALLGGKALSMYGFLLNQSLNQ